ncbi:MAG TPA: nucleotide sugar dehydrogenase, partial [Candidatus Limnocylindrales bacterium]|nr:nucleotide sugar dehydrogenase [Candidatus Limnocylindrales bacterium]
VVEGVLLRDDISVVSNPEFLREGTALHDFLHPDRIVIGADDRRAAEKVASLYASLDAPVLITDPASAETIKYAANAFLATKLSFINEVADLCEAYEADVDAVVEGIGLDPRIGATYLRPGIGFGGSCLPKELANMVRLGQRRGMAMPPMHGAAQTNDGRATRIVDRLEELLGPVHGCRIALLGLSFKPDTDDLRYSPSLAVADVLAARGATVIGHDPAVPVAATSGSAIFRAGTPSEVVAAADLVILGTEWPLYATLDWSGLAARAARPILYDGRNVLDHEALRAAGWRVIAVGRHEEAADGAEAPAATLS